MKKKWFEMLFCFLIAIVMSLTMSLFGILVRIGMVDGWYLLWVKSFATSFIVAIPMALLVIPLIRKTMERLITVKNEE